MMILFFFTANLLAVVTYGSESEGNSVSSEHVYGRVIFIGSVSVLLILSSLACAYYYLQYDCKNCSASHAGDSVRSIEISSDLNLEEAFPNMKPAFARIDSINSNISSISAVSVTQNSTLKERNSVHFDPEVSSPNPREAFTRSRQGSLPILEELMDGSMIDLSDGDEDLVWEEDGNSHQRTHSVIFDVTGTPEACPNKNDYEFQDE